MRALRLHAIGQPLIEDELVIPRPASGQLLVKVAACSPDITVRIPRDACAFHEFWRAKEMIALGRERTARTFAAISSVAAVA